MWKRATFLTRALSTSTSTSETTAAAATTNLYSFLQPSIFAPRKPQTQPQQTPKPQTQTKTQQTPTQTEVESALRSSLLQNDTESAWQSFKTLTSSSSTHLFPSEPLFNSLITHLSLQTHNSLNLKRAFASLIYVIEKNPDILGFETVRVVFNSMNSANAVSPSLALIRCLFKNRVFVPFEYWGCSVVEICKRNGQFSAFLGVFNECCRIAVDEKLESMKPSLVACNAALEVCCCDIESIRDAEGVVEKMSVLGIKPDELSFGLLGYLYAIKAREEKLVELKDLIRRYGFTGKRSLYSNLIRGYVKAGNFVAVSETIFCSLREGNGEDMDFGEETYLELVKGFVDHDGIKGLASLIIEAQRLEPETVVASKSIGFVVVNACVNLGLLDKGRIIIDEMNAQGGLIGLGVYMPILKAYCKENRTAEATQLVMDISNSGLQLDAGSYDMLIEASMSGQDFQSAFTLFRDMREARIPELKASYLTIMTGLMENQRPELMAAFLDEVVEDPLVEVKTHDWNSIIHSFCKAGRLEDARRTLRRMIFLQFEPNDQTYLSLINGFVTAEKYFSVLMLWNEVKRKVSADKESGVKFDQSLVDAFLYALVKGGFFDAVMQVVEKSQEMKIFVDKWRYKQAFMETHKKLKVSKLRRRSFRKMEALIAFKNWAGLNA